MSIRNSVKSLFNCKVHNRTDAGRAPFILIALMMLLLFDSFSLASTAQAVSFSQATQTRAVTQSDIASLTFQSVSVTNNGRTQKLASKKPISIRFTSPTMSFSAGCNSFFGNFSLTNGRLVLSKVASTRMSCSANLMKQDQWLNSFLTSKPTITITKNSKTSKLKPYLYLKTSSREIKLEILETYGYADTPLGDENSETLVKSVCAQLIADKASESQAQFAAEQNALLFRVVAREGVDLPATKDYRINRLNVKISSGIVQECTQG